MKCPAASIFNWDAQCRIVQRNIGNDGNMSAAVFLDHAQRGMHYKTGKNNA
jgi:hypothetical protein